MLSILRSLNSRNKLHLTVLKQDSKEQPPSPQCPTSWLLNQTLGNVRKIFDANN